MGACEKMNKVCICCKARHFACESHKGSLGGPDEPGNASFSSCCGHGKIKLLPLQRPGPVLFGLLNNDDSESKEFRRNLRDYNNTFSFASRGFTGNQFVFPNSRGPQIFKVSGKMYHCMGNVLPDEGESPQFSQMYVYDELGWPKKHHFANIHSARPVSGYIY